MTTEQSTAAALDVSVVIPVFCRVAELKRCLMALAAQTLPPDRFEVVICDDGSPTPVSGALGPALAALRDRLQVRIIRQNNAGPAAARNRAAAAARGRYLAFTDDDCRPEPEWLERLLKHFGAMPNVLLGGALRTSRQSDPYAHATQAIMDFVYADQERRNGLRLFSTSNLALPACAFAELSGFSPVFKRAAGEDYDLCARWYESGGEVAYVADAVVVHDHALTLGSYCFQHFRYGRGLFQMRRRLRQRGARIRRGIVPGGFYVRLIASAVRQRGLRGMRTSALIGLSQAATAAGMMRELIAASANGSPSPGQLPSGAAKH